MFFYKAKFWCFSKCTYSYLFFLVSWLFFLYRHLLSVDFWNCLYTQCSLQPFEIHFQASTCVFAVWVLVLISKKNAARAHTDRKDQKQDQARLIDAIKSIKKSKIVLVSILYMFNSICVKKVQNVTHTRSYHPLWSYLSSPSNTAHENRSLADLCKHIPLHGLQHLHIITNVQNIDL